jgi:hypothetical protein
MTRLTGGFKRNGGKRIHSHAPERLLHKAAQVRFHERRAGFFFGAAARFFLAGAFFRAAVFLAAGARFAAGFRAGTLSSSTLWIFASPQSFSRL